MLIHHKLYYTLYSCYLLLCCSAFHGWSSHVCRAYRQFYLSDKFVPVTEEKTISIHHNHSLFKNMSTSFFAQIGSNPKHAKNEDYHWFDGDGMIHGLFINATTMTYQNKWIQTKRLQVENKWNKKMYLYFGELKGLNGLFQIFKYTIMEILKLVPQAKGTANTAFMRWNDKVYALHEGDMPYEIVVDDKAHNISTSHRIHYPNIFSTTAHPVQDHLRSKLYLYGYNNYDFSDGKFIFNVFDKHMNHLHQRNFSMINNGMTHDVAFTGDYMIIPDMPLKYDPSRMFRKKLPMYFDKKSGVTRFGIFHVAKKDPPKWYTFDENFFIFHFARAYKNVNEFVIFGCAMDELHMEDFVDPNNLENTDHIIRGKLRLKQFTINTKTNKTSIVENPYLQHIDVNFHYNLDFPIQSKRNSQFIYCTIFDSAMGLIRGYVKVDTYNFHESIPRVFLFPKHMYGNSEPQVVEMNNEEYLMTFSNRFEKSYISLINVKTGSMNSINIPTRIPPGFHSIFYDR